jgi:hypothetical protein
MAELTVKDLAVDQLCETQHTGRKPTVTNLKAYTKLINGAG